MENELRLTGSSNGNEMTFTGARDGNGNPVPINVELIPENKLVLSKDNAKTYFKIIKQRIKDTGSGMFEFLETLKFFDKINELIKGNSQATNPEERDGDKEFKKMVLDEVSKYGKEGYVTPRGAKFQTMEAGHRYYFDKCNDPILDAYMEQLSVLEAKIKERQEFLKKVPQAGMELHLGEGELITVYPPYKTSVTTYKITLPK